MPRFEKVDPTSKETEFASAGKRSGRITLALISSLPDKVLSALSGHLQKEFGVPVVSVVFEGTEKDVSYAFNRRRNQYSSPKILGRLRRVPKEPGDKVLGIVDVDLYCPDYDFVFGEADATTGVATLSVYRLKQGADDENLVTSRVIKEATHEIGHLFDLGHCDDPKCVMSFSTGNLWQIDAKSASICADCHSAGLQRNRTIRN